MKKIFISFIALLVVALPVFPASAIDSAYEGEVVLTEEQQIKELQERLVRLKALIADIILGRHIMAESYLVMDITNSTIISQKNITQSHSIASITKLMNAVVAVENLDQDKSIILDEAMLKPAGYSPSLFLKLAVTVKHLLKASLIQSTNDAAQALSIAVGSATADGGVPQDAVKKFVALMNYKARQLGMDDTHFYDAHGLDLKNRSTVFDIAKLLAYIHQNHPDILEITKDDDFWLPDPTGKLLKFKNLNLFSGLPEFIGGKTGYLPEAKQSLAGLFDINGRTVAIILLKTSHQRADALTLIDWVKNNN